MNNGITNTDATAAIMNEADYHARAPTYPRLKQAGRRKEE